MGRKHQPEEAGEWEANHSLFRLTVFAQDADVFLFVWREEIEACI